MTTLVMANGRALSVHGSLNALTLKTIGWFGICRRIELTAPVFTENWTALWTVESPRSGGLERHRGGL